MNKKAFTMVELLVTIIILGLLTTLIITSITSILNRSHKEYYESQENMLILAGRDYYADYRSKLPKEVGETSSVTVETLIKESYIDPVKDRNDNDCDYKKSEVIVQKITDKDYQYYVTLICNEDKYETTEDRADPVIKYTPNKKSSTKLITVKMSVTDDKGVASFRYVITKDDEVIKDSGYQIYTGEIEETFTELGIYRIEGYAIDVSGNSSIRESGIYSVYKGINCAEVDYDSSTKKETWVNKNITVNVKVPSNTYRYEIMTKKDDGSYSLLDSYIGNGNHRVKFDSDGKYQIKVTLYDKDGNTCSISSDGYYLDKTNPTCNTTGAPEDWTNKDVSLKGTCSDTGGSGCKGNVTKKIDSNTNGKVSPGKVYDKAGNSVTCPSVTVKVDKTKPTCKSSGGSSTWTNGSRTIKGTCSDEGGSGCVEDITKTIDEETNGKVSPGKVYDNAGNSATCSGVTVKIDKTKPTCRSSGGSSTWTNGSRTIKGTCSDEGGSKCVDDVTKTIDEETNGKVSPGTVYDNAGNSATCSGVTVKIDKTKPTCESSGGNSTWTNGSRTIKGTCSDEGGSGCVEDVTKTIDKETNGKVSPGKVYDNAGNSRTCSGVTVKIDKTAPTCKSSGGSNAWTTGSRTLIGTCSDTGGSGCKGNVSKKFTTPGEYYNQSPGKVYDNAGNSKTCPADQTVKISDSSGPSKPIIDLHGYKSGSWTNKNVTITMSSQSNIGIDHYEYSHDLVKWQRDYDLDSEHWQQSFNEDRTSMTVTISWTGNWNFYVRAIDKAGNVSPIADVFTIRIDKIPPKAPKFVSFIEEKGSNLDNNNCSGVGGGNSNASCTVNGNASWLGYWFSTNLEYSDEGGSGINKDQYIWEHDGPAKKCLTWVDDCSPWATATPSGHANYIVHRVRLIDNAGNIGYETRITHYISYPY